MKDDGTAELIAERMCENAAKYDGRSSVPLYEALVQKEMVPLIEAALGIRELVDNVQHWPSDQRTLAAFDAILEKMGVQR